ncbi:hypothetical protein RRG08_000650 [Elysia crispata]|uniref:Uncharacterized protein n=1 Tax=Elysia crispata TaxID=231223 RepID=A0AAE0Y8H3_9GAST|nr:hypothetical protein RRG08_000650 [Elysia crispata]
MMANYRAVRPNKIRMAGSREPGGSASQHSADRESGPAVIRKITVFCQSVCLNRFWQDLLLSSPAVAIGDTWRWRLCRLTSLKERFPLPSHVVSEIQTSSLCHVSRAHFTPPMHNDARSIPPAHRFTTGLKRLTRPLWLTIKASAGLACEDKELLLSPVLLMGSNCRQDEFYHELFEGVGERWRYKKNSGVPYSKISQSEHEPPDVKFLNVSYCRQMLGASICACGTVRTLHSNSFRFGSSDEDKKLGARVKAHRFECESVGASGWVRVSARAILAAGCKTILNGFWKSSLPCLNEHHLLYSPIAFQDHRLYAKGGFVPLTTGVGLEGGEKLDHGRSQKSKELGGGEKSSTAPDNFRGRKVRVNLFKAASAFSNYGQIVSFLRAKASNYQYLIAPRPMQRNVSGQAALQGPLIAVSGSLLLYLIDRFSSCPDGACHLFAASLLMDGNNEVTVRYDYSVSGY